MITCKEDLIGTYVLTSDKEVLKLFIEACDKFDIRWCDELRASQQYPDADIFRVHKSACLQYGYVWSTNITKFYTQLTLADFISIENATQAPVSKDTFDAHKHTIEENKRATGVPSPIIVEDGSACDTRKDVFREMLTLTRENNCMVTFEGMYDDENDCIVVTFADSDEEYVVQSAADFKKLIDAQETLNKFLRVV